MNLSMSLAAGRTGKLTVLSEDGERVLCRGWCVDDDGERPPMLAVLSASEHPTPGFVDRLAHEYGLKDELDGPWAARPLALVREHRWTVLLLEDPGGEPLDRLLGQPMETGKFLRFATNLSAALGQFHKRGLIHKDIKPANVLVDFATGQVWLTGFGITSRFPRERQSPQTPELIAGTLAYMAPEQTGRMNRSVDSRCDLYSLGVTFYEMLTGSLPFTAAQPMEWVHCHIARQPARPNERVADVPGPLSAMVMKLLAKSAEERYQTAVGIEADLRQALAEWEAQGRIKPFQLGAYDVSDRLLIPEKLYGRGREIDTLLAAFDRVVASEAPVLALVSGYAGIGKSSVVNELHKALVPQRGLFASGKFDQYKRDIPYATLAQAFQSLLRHILGQTAVELEQWRGALRAALGGNAGLMVNLVPELELVIGKQPPVPELPPQEAKNRFQMVFRCFLGVFARREHPLALFLDDLQWLDTATLDLLENLVTHSEVRCLMLVGAYRDNEVGPAHPLMRTLEAIRKADANVLEIVLAPLGCDDVGRLISDGLHCEPERARPLVGLVHEKTGGNPFFAIQFITALTEQGLIAFDPIAPAWQWDMDRIRAKGNTDNVLDLMVEKLKRLSASSREALKLVACLGIAEVATLALVQGDTEEAIHTALWEAVHAGLVFREEDAYKFLHDRIQQAAYSLIPEPLRPEIHLCIGRALLASMTADQLAEHPFDVANQFSRAAGRFIDRDEKAKVATIDLRAGRKAKASAAYASACMYLAAGMELLDESDWSSQYALTFSLWLERAECEFLSSRFEKAEQLIVELLQRGTSKVDEAAVYHLKIQLHVLKSEYEQAVATAITCLRLFGIDMPAHPTQEQVQAEYEAVWQTLDGRPIESLIDLPLMSDPEQQAAMQVLSVLILPAYFTDFRLCCLLLCHMVKVSLQHGTSDPSATAYGIWGNTVLLGVFHRYDEAYRFAKLACAQVEKHGLIASRSKVYTATGTAAVWTQPITVANDFLRSGFRSAIETGDPTFACLTAFTLISNLFMRNDPLDVVWREAQIALDSAREAKYGDAAAIIESQQRFIATMQGRTATFSSFSDAHIDEATFETQLIGERTPFVLCQYWILKLKARFLSRDYVEALAAADQAKLIVSSAAATKSWPSTPGAPFGQIYLPDYFYYAALTVTALYEKATADEKAGWRELLREHEEQLREWAENYPPTFLDKHALVSAEIARLEGRDADAMRLYEQAIRSAGEHGFVQNEGLAHEVAARFYAARDFETIANAYLRNARYCYLRWGADGKVRQLDRLHPHLAAAEANRPTATIGSPVQQLDVASVVRASQAVSSEIELPKLIEQLMTIALENAGADRGLLIFPAEHDYLVQAEARAAGDRVEVALGQKPIRGITCPESLVRYVIRTHESVILDDASKPNLFSDDDYLRGRKARSILCLPLIKQGRLTGLLYLENTLTSHAFPPNRIGILDLLAAQAAISLENTRLYSDLQEREAKVRRLIDSNIIGICIYDLEGRITEANEAFLRMVGYSRDDLASGRVRWTALTHNEWRDGSEQALAELKAAGSVKPFEKEYLRKDGTRVPVLVGPAIFGEEDQGVAFVLDLTERKEAEENLRESEQRYREAQAELAHITRVTTLGELTASIAHEVNQPLTGVVTYGDACLRWLDREVPQLDQARSAVELMISSARHASDVIARLRALSKKGALERVRLDINNVIDDVIALTHREINIHSVSLRLDLGSSLPPILGDRVQLQQVVMNLLINGIQAMSHVTDHCRELRIRSREHGSDQILIAVEDSGIGIEPENVDRLFDVFFTTKPDGMGMGLSICRSIIAQHGGRIWASHNSEAGSTFQFTLPSCRETTS